MTVHRLDHCQVCHTGVDLDWSAYVCEHGVAFCGGCESYLACRECDADRWADAAEATVLATGGDTHAAARAADRTRRPAPWVDDDGAEEAHDARHDRGADTDQAADRAADRFERRLG